MRFTFKFSNDFGEPADFCLRCGKDTRERCLLSCPGLRLLVYACRPCLYELAAFAWFFHEFPLRAVLKARDQADAGESVYQYENSFTWNGANGSPPASPERKKQCPIGRKKKNGNGGLPRGV